MISFHLVFFFSRNPFLDLPFLVQFIKVSRYDGYPALQTHQTELFENFRLEKVPFKAV